MTASGSKAPEAFGAGRRSISAVLQKRTLANTSLWVQSTVPVNPRRPGVNRVNLLACGVNVLTV
jgi:hypothetical protein